MSSRGERTGHGIQARAAGRDRRKEEKVKKKKEETENDDAKDTRSIQTAIDDSSGWVMLYADAAGKIEGDRRVLERNGESDYSSGRSGWSRREGILELFMGRWTVSGHGAW